MYFHSEILLAIHALFFHNMCFPHIGSNIRRQVDAGICSRLGPQVEGTVLADGLSNMTWNLNFYSLSQKVKAHGPGLKGGLVGRPAEFTIDTKGAGTGGLGLTVEGPCEAKIECSDNGDGTCSVSYLPTKPGEYFVNILFEEVHIPGSPFKADIEMPFDPSKVVASGPGLEHGKVGEAALLSVDCSEAGPGNLGLEAVSDSGSRAEVSIQNNKDGTYVVTYMPLTAGMYTLTMKYGGELVPHFPARVKVEPTVDTSRVKVFGPGIEGNGRFH